MKDLIKPEAAELIAQDDIRTRIITVRGVQVILDRDLAELYGVDVKRLNEQVSRNIERFPDRFMHQLTQEEFSDLKSQIATSSFGADLTRLKSQFATSSWGGVRKPPRVFTEQGVSMLSAVLRSPTAVETSIRIMDAFVAMRHVLASMPPLMARLEEIEHRQIADQARNEGRFKFILDAMRSGEFPPQQIFFDGEFFDAFEQMKRFIRLAKKELIVIDPYFDDSVLSLLAQKRPGVMVTVVQCTRGQRNLHAIDVKQFNQQYANSLMVKVTDKFHDRFLVIDQKTLIHIGASLNYLGKKCFGFSTMDAEMIPDILARIP